MQGLARDELLGHLPLAARRRRCPQGRGAACSVLRRYGGSSSFGVVDRDQLVHIARARSPSILHLSLGPHTRQPPPILSIKRVLREVLAQDRAQGWVAMRDDLTYGVMAIAVLVRACRGRVMTKRPGFGT